MSGPHNDFYISEPFMLQWVPKRCYSTTTHYCNNSKTATFICLVIALHQGQHIQYGRAAYQISRRFQNRHRIRYLPRILRYKRKYPLPPLLMTWSLQKMKLYRWKHQELSKINCIQFCTRNPNVNCLTLLDKEFPELEAYSSDSTSGSEDDDRNKKTPELK